MILSETQNWSGARNMTTQTTDCMVLYIRRILPEINMKYYFEQLIAVSGVFSWALLLVSGVKYLNFNVSLDITCVGSLRVLRSPPTVKNMSIMLICLSKLNLNP